MAAERTLVRGSDRAPGRDGDATTPHEAQNASADVQWREEPDGRGLLSVSGSVDVAALPALWTRAMAIAQSRQGRVDAIDARRVRSCDAAGARFLIELRERSQARSKAILGLNAAAQELVQMLEPGAAVHEDEAGRASWLSRLGAWAMEMSAELRAQVAFTGELCVMLFGTLRHPRRLRLRDAIRVAERAGIGAVPIVTLIGFLLGLILAFQSAIPMQRFGAEIFIADLLGVSLPRELGPLMAAILLTARSGSAFAAEIGTMRVNEELDALSTMGIEPVRFLVVPRMLAALAVVPALTMLVTASGLLGGALVFVSLDYPLVTYMNRVRDITEAGDLIGGIAKAMVFGIQVAAIGCLRGLQTGTDAGAVGRSTTRAVVSGIVLIACTDGVFAVIFYVLGF